MYDIAVNNGDIWLRGQWTRASVAIQDGAISAIAAHPLQAHRTVDAEGSMVLPGVVDAHTHMRDPAYPEKEDFVSGTSAAAIGGVTTILEMPMADVGTATVDRFASRMQTLEPKAVVDFGLIAGASDQYLDELPGLVDIGAAGFKSFLREPYPSRRANFDGTYVTTRAGLYRTAQAMGSIDRTWAVHVEAADVTESLEEELGFQSAETTEDANRVFLESRPVSIETVPLAMCLLYARESDARLHVVHVTSAEAVDLIRLAAKGQSVSAEYCIPHLIAGEDWMAGSLGALGRISPRLRGESDRAAMWKSAAYDPWTTIASDHASYRKEDILQGWDENGRPTVGGVAGTEHMLVLALTEADRRGLPRGAIVDCLTRKPAARFGLWRKGTLDLGTDGDVIVVDSDPWTIEGRTMMSKARWSIFEDSEVKYRVRTTIVRGELVVDDGHLVGSPGSGRFIRPSASPEVSIG